MISEGEEELMEDEDEWVNLSRVKSLLLKQSL